MGFGSRGQQSPAADYSAKRGVNGACGTSGNNVCTTATLYGTTPSPAPSPVTISATITGMTTTSITYTINSINGSTSTSTSYSFTSTNYPNFSIQIDNGNATSTLPSSIVVGNTYTTLLSEINLSLGTYTVTINNINNVLPSTSWLTITSLPITLSITS